MFKKLSSMAVKEKIGQRFALGFSGTVVSEELRRLIQEYKIGNIILFRENLSGAAQGKELCASLQSLIMGETGIPAFISIDQEGGVVTRLPADMVNVPGAMALAATGDSNTVYEAAKITIHELRRIGVNLNLAPVLDINSNPDNPVIGVRSFGGDKKIVAEYAGAAIRAYGEENFLCCGKHFPGHGDTNIDSHLDLPLVNKKAEELEDCELSPFRSAIAAGLPAIMSTHILFPQLEEQKVPATMSRAIITGLLKEKMGFSGLILSDGMEMEAIKKFYGVPAGCVEALRAGVDMIFVCHDPHLMEESIKAVTAAYGEGKFDTGEFDASVEKILRYKEQYVLPLEKAETPALPEKRIADLCARNAALMRRTIASADQNQKIPPLGEHPLFIGPLPYRSTIASSKADGSLSFSRWFAERFGGVSAEIAVNPDGEEIERVTNMAVAINAATTATAAAANTAAAAAEVTAVVLGCYNGHLNRGQIELARSLAATAEKRGIPFVAVTLRNPYDLKEIPSSSFRLAAWEYTRNSFEALEGVLRGDYIPSRV